MFSTGITKRRKRSPITPIRASMHLLASSRRTVLSDEEITLVAHRWGLVRDILSSVRFPVTCKLGALGLTKMVLIVEAREDERLSTWTANLAKTGLTIATEKGATAIVFDA